MYGLIDLEDDSNLYIPNADENAIPMLHDNVALSVMNSLTTKP